MIKASGAAGGGLTQAETVLNPKGYRITGTTTTNKIVVNSGVTTDLTFDNVSITNNSRSENCVTVSHANVTITLIGENVLSCGTERYGALVKDGMDDKTLTLQCEHAGENGHKCEKGTCGSLKASGTKVHTTAIGSSSEKAALENETGFSNLVIKGGVITATAGDHNCAIGSACNTYNSGRGYTRNISISGGIVNAKGGTACAGIGSGAYTPVDGIYITGGTVFASGGEDSPGIGSGGLTASVSPVGTVKLDVSNVVISGGDTVVTAVGDIATNMPGIGCGVSPNDMPKGVAKNITASPKTGYQGYIQDGTSEEDYNFTSNSPFPSGTAISVEKYYTKIYFGPYRDENTIEKDTKEQIGANHVISKTGGSGFEKAQLKELAKVNGKKESGSSFSSDELHFSDERQIEAINKAKTSGKIGDFPLTFETPSKTKVTVIVSLRDSGTDASKLDPQNPAPVIGANDFVQDTGGDAFTEEQMKKYGEVKGKDKEGNTISLEDFVIDAEQFQKINEAKTAGDIGVFDLTYTAADGNQVKVKVALVKYDETEKDPESGESIKGMNVISKTGGQGFSEDQVKELTKVQAFDENGHKIPAEELVLSDPDELKAINEAKAAGETGDFSLSFETAGKTKVTVTVFLRDEGTDGAETEAGNPQASIAADDASHKTRGDAFTKEELIKLCKAKGKDEARNNADLTIDKEQMEKLNAAKQAGKTGVFELTFFVAGGKEAKVKITLTGEHKVRFNPNGGDFTPKTQTVIGGKCAVEPKEPGREGYVFEGWYYKDENGTEQKWDFETPVHSDVSLKAKWKKEKQESIAPENKEKTGGNTARKKKESYYWDSKDITNHYTDSRSVAKTGDTTQMAVILLMIAAGGGVLYLLYRRRRIFKN